MLETKRVQFFWLTVYILLLYSADTALMHCWSTISLLCAEEIERASERLKLAYSVASVGRSGTVMKRSWATLTYRTACIVTPAGPTCHKHSLTLLDSLSSSVRLSVCLPVCVCPETSRYSTAHYRPANERLLPGVICVDQCSHVHKR